MPHTKLHQLVRACLAAQGYKEGLGMCLNTSVNASYLFMRFALMALLPTAGVAQSTEADELNRLDELVPRLMLENNIPGLALSVIGKSSESVTRSYGVLNSESDNPVINTTVFEAASTSKPMFARVVMELVEQNMLTLDEPLSDYLEFESIANDERSHLITPRMILTHTSGLPNALSRGERPSITFEPGTQYQYSGWGFRYLQNVIEELTARTLTEVMREELFDPLDMTEASYLWKEEFEDIAADGHGSDGEFSREMVKLTAEYAEGGILINIIELSRFLEHTLVEYQSGNPILNAMISPSVQVSDHGNKGSMWRGLGWALERTPQGLSIWHGGSNGAFKAFLFLDLEQEAGLAFLANSSNGLTIVPDIIDSLFGEHHFFQEYFSSR